MSITFTINGQKFDYDDIHNACSKHEIEAILTRVNFKNQNDFWTFYAYLYKDGRIHRALALGAISKLTRQPWYQGKKHNAANTLLWTNSAAATKNLQQAAKLKPGFSDSNFNVSYDADSGYTEASLAAPHPTLTDASCARKRKENNSKYHDF